MRRISILTVLLTVCAATMAQGLKDVLGGGSSHYMFLILAANH